MAGDRGQTRISLRLRLLVGALRLVEKPHLARAPGPEALRRRFERTARLWLRAAPRWRFADDALDGVPVTWADPPQGRQARVVLYFHGGGYIFGSPRTHRAMVSRLAQMCGASACLPAYRLAPEHPFPAAPEDALRCYRALLARGVTPGRIVLGGDSAGGGLALAVLAMIGQEGLPPPAGCFAFSPLCDLSFSGESIRGNAVRDPMLPATRTADIARMYLAGAGPRDARASPLFADFDGPPPVWLSVGACEILRDDSRRMARHLARSGCDVQLTEHPAAPHAWPLFPALIPESARTLREVAAWISRRFAPTDES